MELLTVNENNKHILYHLMQAYEAEFSAITGKVPNADGLFARDTEWDTDHDAYLVFLDGAPVGFAIKGNLDQHHDISEFYIIPCKRGRQLGAQVACAVFDRYEGAWQVRQIEGADQARLFWRKAIRHYVGEAFEEEQVIDPDWGRVTRQRFRKGPRPSNEQVD